MAQLTLSQRSELQNNARFQQRLGSAVVKTAKFWNDFVVDTFAEYNVANQKRKAFAKLVLKGGVGNISSYAGSFLGSYNVDIADVGIKETEDAFNVSTNQLADAQLTDSSSASYTFDYFANVEIGDETKQINL